MKSLSFFSGGFGLDLGLKKAGINQVLFCENDKICIETIEANEPNVPLISNILDYSAEDICSHANIKSGDDIDLIVGGTPCQAFSTAGKREVLETQEVMFLYFIKIIKDISPNYFVIENVRGLLSASLKHRPLSERGKNNPHFQLMSFLEVH